jgi:hypothetical protein
MTIAILIIFILLFTCVKLNNSKSKTETILQNLVNDIQSTKNIKTIIEYQDRTYVTQLNKKTIYSSMDDSEDFSIVDK